MSHHRPTPQRPYPVSPTQRPTCPQIIEPSLPMCLQHVPSVKVAIAAAGSMVWENKFNASKTRVMGGGLALGGRR
jgi:hypothetical protein